MFARGKFLELDWEFEVVSYRVKDVSMTLAG
jgi:hypothetical protein